MTVKSTKKRAVSKKKPLVSSCIDEIEYPKNSICPACKKSKYKLNKKKNRFSCIKYYLLCECGNDFIEIIKK